MEARSSFAKLLQFHQRLNPHLWHDRRLRPEVRLKLLQAGIAFYRFLDLPSLRISDIVLTGSNAAFNYTSLSDIDVHLLVAYHNTSCPTLADNFFNTKRNLWNRTYTIAVHGHPIELYVEDTADPAYSNGVFSILHNHWLKRPTPRPTPPDDPALRLKVDSYADEIDTLLAADPKRSDVDDLLQRLRKMRISGLLSGGEFALENLTYKMLRGLGYLQRLADKRVELRDKSLTL